MNEDFQPSPSLEVSNIRLNRQEFVKLALHGGLALALAACGFRSDAITTPDVTPDTKPTPTEVLPQPTIVAPTEVPIGSQAPEVTPVAASEIPGSSTIQSEFRDQIGAEGKVVGLQYDLTDEHGVTKTYQSPFIEVAEGDKVGLYSVVRDKENKLNFGLLKWEIFGPSDEHLSLGYEYEAVPGAPAWNPVFVGSNVDGHWPAGATLEFYPNSPFVVQNPSENALQVSEAKLASIRLELTPTPEPTEVPEQVESLVCDSEVMCQHVQEALETPYEGEIAPLFIRTGGEVKEITPGVQEFGFEESGARQEFIAGAVTEIIDLPGDHQAFVLTVDTPEVKWNIVFYMPNQSNIMQNIFVLPEGTVDLDFIQENEYGIWGVDRNPVPYNYVWDLFKNEKESILGKMVIIGLETSGLNRNAPQMHQMIEAMKAGKPMDISQLVSPLVPVSYLFFEDIITILNSVR